MNEKRAKEIASSPVMANVTYNGSQIYIESVNESNHSATIHLLNQPENREEVLLSGLTEQEYWKK